MLVVLALGLVALMGATGVWIGALSAGVMGPGASLNAAMEEPAVEPAIERVNSVNKRSASGTQVRTLVVTELASTQNHVRHFFVMLHPSWEALWRRPPAEQLAHDFVRVDLFVACEPGLACATMRANSACREVRSAAEVVSQAPPALARGGDCFFAEVPPRAHETYRFLHSLNFMQMPPFTGIVRLGLYDWVLRTDADAALFPGLLAEAPRAADTDGMIGAGFNGNELTDHLIEQFAEEELRLHFNEHPPAALRMQSTFYIRADVITPFVDRLIVATRALWERGFQKRKCAALDATEAAARLAPGKLKLCRWPYWHRNVASLYGTAIAANTVLRKPKVTEKLDSTAAALRRRYLRDPDVVMQAHYINTKFAIVNTGAKLCSTDAELVADLRASKLPSVLTLAMDLAKGNDTVPQRVAPARGDRISHYLARVLYATLCCHNYTSANMTEILDPVFGVAWE